MSCLTRNEIKKQAAAALADVIAVMRSPAVMPGPGDISLAGSLLIFHELDRLGSVAERIADALEDSTPKAARDDAFAALQELLRVITASLSDPNSSEWTDAVHAAERCVERYR